MFMLVCVCWFSLYVLFCVAFWGGGFVRFMLFVVVVVVVLFVLNRVD